jgi:hypothetical protein
MSLEEANKRFFINYQNTKSVKVLQIHRIRTESMDLITKDQVEQFVELKISSVSGRNTILLLVDKKKTKKKGAGSCY